MPRASKPEQADIPVMVGRRSTRISVAIPITITGKDAAGNDFRENTFTLNVNKHGAEIATSRPLASNAEVTLENSTLGRQARARVVLRRERRTPNSPYEVSLELLDPENIWGVRFPPADWEQSAPPKAAGLSASAENVPSAASLAGTKRDEPLPTTTESAEVTSESPRVAEDREQPPISDTTVEIAAPKLAAEPQAAAPEASAASGIPQPETPAPEPEASSVDDQVQAASAAMTRLSELVIRLEAASAQVEGMLAKAGEARARLQTEMNRLTSETQLASQKAAESALEEFRSRLGAEWESQSARLLEDTKRRVQEEVSAAITAFGREAGAHLARLTQESGPELEAKQKLAVSAAKEQVAHAADAAVSECHQSLGRMTEEIVASLNSRMQASLDKAVADSSDRLTASLRGQAEKLLQSEASPVPRLRQQMQEESANAGARFKEACAKEIERASSSLKEEIMKALSSLTSAAADANAGLWESAKAIKHDLTFKGEKIRAQLAEISSASEEGFKNYLQVRVKGAQEEVQMNLRVVADKASQDFSERLQKHTDGLLESFGPQLQRQAEDATMLCKGSLESATRESLAETQKLLENATREALEAFSGEVQARLEQFRGQLRATLEESLSSGAQEMQARLRQVGEEQERAALARIQSEGKATGERVIGEIDGRVLEAKTESERLTAEIQKCGSQLAADGDRVVAETKDRAEATARHAADAVYKQLGVATVVLKDLSDQAAARLESQFRESMTAFEKQVQELANRSLEASRVQSDATMQETRRRLEQATRILRGEASDPKHPSS